MAVLKDACETLLAWGTTGDVFMAQITLNRIALEAQAGAGLADVVELARKAEAEPEQPHLSEEHDRRRRCWLYGCDPVPLAVWVGIGLLCLGFLALAAWWLWSVATGVPAAMAEARITAEALACGAC